MLSIANETRSLKVELCAACLKLNQYFLRRSCYFIPPIVSETLKAATCFELVAAVNRERQSFRL